MHMAEDSLMILIESLCTVDVPDGLLSCIGECL
jgi:hypothetical protein